MLFWSVGLMMPVVCINFMLLVVGAPPGGSRFSLYLSWPYEFSQQKIWWSLRVMRARPLHDASG